MNVACALERVAMHAHLPPNTHHTQRIGPVTKVPHTVIIEGDGQRRTSLDGHDPDDDRHERGEDGQGHHRQQTRDQSVQEAVRVRSPQPEGS